MNYNKPLHGVFSCWDLDSVFCRCQNGELACLHRLRVKDGTCPCLSTRYSISFFWVIRFVWFLCLSLGDLVGRFLWCRSSFLWKEEINHVSPFTSLLSGESLLFGILYEESFELKSWKKSNMCISQLQVNFIREGFWAKLSQVRVAFSWVLYNVKQKPMQLLFQPRT